MSAAQHHRHVRHVGVQFVLDRQLAERIGWRAVKRIGPGDVARIGSGVSQVAGAEARTDQVAGTEEGA